MLIYVFSIEVSDHAVNDVVMIPVCHLWVRMKLGEVLIPTFTINTPWSVFSNEVWSTKDEEEKNDGLEDGHTSDMLGHL